jgi:hypothetical protein
MRIFVVGSSRHLTEPEKDRVASFKEFCRSLGTCFADKGWTVLVGSQDEGTADHWLLRGMEDAAAKAKSLTRTSIETRLSM